MLQHHWPAVHSALSRVIPSCIVTWAIDNILAFNTSLPTQSYPPNRRKLFSFLNVSVFLPINLISFKYWHGIMLLSIPNHCSSSVVTTLPNVLELFLDLCGSTVQHSCIFLPIAGFLLIHQNAKRKHLLNPKQSNKYLPIIYLVFIWIIPLKSCTSLCVSERAFFTGNTEVLNSGWHPLSSIQYHIQDVILRFLQGLVHSLTGSSMPFSVGSATMQSFPSYVSI